MFFFPPPFDFRLCQIMPEVDKDEILAAHHISQESMLGIDVSALPHANPIGAAGAIDGAFVHQTKDGRTHLPKNYEHTRPLTAPPSASLSRAEIRTISEPATPPRYSTNDAKQLGENDQYSPKTRSPSPIAQQLSWHPHVYAKPPKAPTPHTIGDILGLPRTPPMEYGSIDTNVSRSTISQILNGKSTNESKSKTSNHLHDRLLMGSGAAPLVAGNTHFENGLVTNFSGRSERSMSEGSEDDTSAISDQPLNLCISRTERDASPSMNVTNSKGNIAKTAIKQKKGKFLEQCAAYIFSFFKVIVHQFVYNVYLKYFLTYLPRKTRE